MYQCLTEVCYKLSCTCISLQIKSKGLVVGSGTVYMKRKRMLVSIEITADMAPSSLLVVYYTRTDGAIVADSLLFEVLPLFQNQVLSKSPM